MTFRPLVSLSEREREELAAKAEAYHGGRRALDDAADALRRAAYLSATVDDLDTARRARAALDLLTEGHGPSLEKLHVSQPAPG